jgi:hypothetical protein
MIASCQWASRPWRHSALALACRGSRLFIGRPLELIIEFEPGRSDGNVAYHGARSVNPAKVGCSASASPPFKRWGDCRSAP